MKRNHTNNREPRSGISPYRRHRKRPFTYSGIAELAVHAAKFFGTSLRGAILYPCQADTRSLSDRTYPGHCFTEAYDHAEAY